MSTQTQITELTMRTLLYAVPISHAQLREASLRQLATYIGRVAGRMPEQDLRDLEHGMTRLVDNEGPMFDRQRYTLVQSRVAALVPFLTAHQGGAEVHPIETAPDHLWPN
ncbi:hypothetical protein [Haloactinomyces albus]|uniref:Uncharacterized protein n=1 Tax=Haloactinomyces albus TaxID=1352928 RepID=A0AAE3ZIP7_9ACTN|nr:hypothetical protein [Haloactinomyces albus]MDR7301632.1 hypothetical protein [Haloactinomyces albus]MDR7304666.1 hypothetical protein [Haloactinomyces albus]MDR7304676.1 hypothetical protein [Haloactinomyces albus]MDR7304686.1 hypothetical protein [Haloactinomyces albus]MDR7304702.1 hypothetical protein [Haloactinomyces albus]